MLFPWFIYFGKSALVMLKADLGWGWQNQQLLIKFFALLYSWTFLNYYFVSRYLFWAWDSWDRLHLGRWPLRKQKGNMCRGRETGRDSLQSSMCVQKRKKNIYIYSRGEGVRRQDFPAGKNKKKSESHLATLSNLWISVYKSHSLWHPGKFGIVITVIFTYEKHLGNYILTVPPSWKR